MLFMFYEWKRIVTNTVFINVTYGMAFRHEVGNSSAHNSLTLSLYNNTIAIRIEPNINNTILKI